MNQQSWFVNKTEARKQFIERVNKTLKTELIVDDKDLTDLTKIDPYPVAEGRFDTTSDTFAELSCKCSKALKSKCIRS